MGKLRERQKEFTQSMSWPRSANTSHREQTITKLPFLTLSNLLLSSQREGVDVQVMECSVPFQLHFIHGYCRPGAGWSQDVPSNSESFRKRCVSNVKPIWLTDYKTVAVGWFWMHFTVWLCAAWAGVTESCIGVNHPKIPSFPGSAFCYSCDPMWRLCWTPFPHIPDGSFPS